MPVDSSAPLREIVEDYKSKNADEMYKDLTSIPFFMQEYKETEEENPQIEALRALAYEGSPWEIAENFKNQGNDCFREKKFKDAVAFYNQALEQNIGDDHEKVTIACLGNRAQANMELKNYRRCITDCLRILDIQNSNIKAWFRSAKAFYLLRKPDECIACCERGLGYEPGNETLLDMIHNAQELKAEQQAYHEAKLAREEAIEARRQVLENVKKDRKFQFMYTVTNNDTTNPGGIKMHLEDPMDPNSVLYVPVLALYPIAYESDILQEVDESATISDIVEKLFQNPPQWAEKSKYIPQNLDCFVQTASGGLAKVGAQSSLKKVFGTPNVIMIDDMARIYILPKEESRKWIESWNKDAQVKQLKA